ncbi:DUF4624 family lipoprotein [Clostridioides sp. ZZV15-6383]|uniref:DUF4624 family lipoprotein n=1 Tax=Clostridioides sp. ZZV15-6383 TaxID=2811498 RepID=UPI001D102288|nr:DUF4624 family lipoprotein [Clostridioides sp. ZZV15-6383]
MKKIAVLFVMLISIAGLTASASDNANTLNTSGDDKATIKIELDKDYDDTDPFVNEKLFCVSKNLDALIADGTFKMDGESGILEVKNNKTNEVLWSNTWEGNVKSETFPISLENLKKYSEYVVCFTGRKINYRV